MSQVVYAPVPQGPQGQGLSTGAKLGIAAAVIVVLYILFKDKIDAYLAGTQMTVSPAGPTQVVPGADGKPVAVTPAVVTVSPAAPPAAPSYAYKGCYTDDGSRKLPQHLGNLSIADCANQAKAKGFKAFGIQYSAGSGLLGVGGECWTGNDSGYAALGPATNCESSGGKQFGGAWSNAVYEWDRL